MSWIAPGIKVLLNLPFVFLEIASSIPRLDNAILRESLNKFQDFFHMGTFSDSTHMNL